MDADILAKAKEWKARSDLALDAARQNMGVDPTKFVRFNTASIEIEGRVIRFSDDGEPYFCDGIT